MSNKRKFAYEGLFKIWNKKYLTKINFHICVCVNFRVFNCMHRHWLKDWQMESDLSRHKEFEYLTKQKLMLRPLLFFFYKKSFNLYYYSECQKPNEGILRKKMLIFFSFAPPYHMNLVKQYFKLLLYEARHWKGDSMIIVTEHSFQVLWGWTPKSARNTYCWNKEKKRL